MIIFLIIIVTIIKENNDIKELIIKEEQEEKRQDKLKTCISTAKNDRSALWEANCPDDNLNCKLQSNIVEWIDTRYKQELEICYELYGN